MMAVSASCQKLLREAERVSASFNMVACIESYLVSALCTGCASVTRLPITWLHSGTNYKIEILLQGEISALCEKLILL